MSCELLWGFSQERHFIPASFRPPSCSGEIPRTELCKFPRVNPTLSPGNSTAQDLSDLATFPFPIPSLLFIPPQDVYPAIKLDYLPLENINSSDKGWQGRNSGEHGPNCFVKIRHESIFKNSNPCVTFTEGDIISILEYNEDVVLSLSEFSCVCTHMCMYLYICVGR